MRLIDADKLNKKRKFMFNIVQGLCPKSEWFFRVSDLLAAPTVVDAVCVVHCRDCIYFANGENDAEKWSWCKRHSHDAYPHEFCSWGARKAGGTDA